MREADLQSFSRQPTCPEACEESVPLLSALSVRRIPFMLCRRLSSQYLQQPCAPLLQDASQQTALATFLHTVRHSARDMQLVTEGLPASLQGPDTKHECCLRTLGGNAHVMLSLPGRFRTAGQEDPDQHGLAG